MVSCLLLVLSASTFGLAAKESSLAENALAFGIAPVNAQKAPASSLTETKTRNPSPHLAPPHPKPAAVQDNARHPALRHVRQVQQQQQQPQSNLCLKCEAELNGQPKNRPTEAHVKNTSNRLKRKASDEDSNSSADSVERNPEVLINPIESVDKPKGPHRETRSAEQSSSEKPTTKDETRKPKRSATKKPPSLLDALTPTPSKAYQQTDAPETSGSVLELRKLEKREENEQEPTNNSKEQTLGVAIFPISFGAERNETSQFKSTEH